MLQFETLLMRQLQKQQTRDEFCDTILYTQGVSVPVHSCVLSAFSPRFCGMLSSMPVLITGQRRLVQLQAVDGSTLLSLVSLLYSGQLHENREQVLSAAQALGFELPQWEEEEEEEERRVEKVGRKMGGNAEEEKEVDAQEWDDGMRRRTGKTSRRENVRRTESGTQTEGGKQTDKSGGPMYRLATSQEPGSCVDIQNVALPLHAVHPASVMASGTGHGQPSAFVSEIHLYSLEMSNHQTSPSVSHNSFLDHRVDISSAGTDATNGPKQFERNIPGFINYFLNSTDFRNKERRGQSCARDVAKEEKVVKSSRARPTSRESGTEWRSLTGGERRRQRWGSVASLAWRGQGGGRVGRLLESRSTRKNRMRAVPRQQVREALVKAGEARRRGRRLAGKVEGSETQKNTACKHRWKGRPRVRSLPLASRSLSASNQNTVDPPDLLHTMTSVPVIQIEPIQPIDTLLEDIMTGLHFLHQTENLNSLHGLITTTPFSGPPILKASYLKPADPKQHMEGEIGDILDHLLKTFDQQVGCCGLDVGGETSQGRNKPDSGSDPCSSTSKTFTQLQPYNSHVNQKPQANYLHTSGGRSAQRQSVVYHSVANKDNVRDGPKHQPKQKIPSRDQIIAKESENRRLTRSQTLKRKVVAALLNPQNAVQQKWKEKEGERKRQRSDRKCPRCNARLNKSGAKKTPKNNKKRSQERQKQGRGREGKSGKNRCSKNRRSVKNKSSKPDGFKRKKKEKRKSSHQKGRHGNNGWSETKKNIARKRVARCKTDRFQARQSSVRNQIESSFKGRTSPAMEKVKQLGEKKKKGRACKYVGIHWRKNEENGRLVKHHCISGAEEGFPNEKSLKKKQEEKDKRRITVKEEERVNSIKEVRQKREDSRTADGTRQEEEAINGSNVSLQLNLPSDTTKEGIKKTTAPVSATESVPKVMDSWLSGPISAPGIPSLHSDVMLASSRSATLHRTTDSPLNLGDATRLPSGPRLTHTRPFQELPGVLASTGDTQQLSFSSVDEEEDVDVVEVFSPTLELPAISILEVDLSTEDEEEEDFEIDVLGAE